MFSLGLLLNCNDRESRTKVNGEQWDRDSVRKHSADLDWSKLENTRTKQKPEEKKKKKARWQRYSTSTWASTVDITQKEGVFIAQKTNQWENYRQSFGEYGQ